MIYAGVGIIILMTLVMAAQSYKRCPKDGMLVVFNKISGNLVISSISAGGVVLIPFVHGFLTVPSGLITLGVDLYGVILKSKERVNLSFIYTVEFSKKQEFLQHAVDNIEFFNTKNLLPKIRELIEEQIERNMKQMTIQEVGNKEKFMEKINYDVRNKIRQYGLELRESMMVDVKNN